MADRLEILIVAQNRVTEKLKKVQADFQKLEASVQASTVANNANTRSTLAMGAAMKKAGAQATTLRTTLVSLGAIVLFANAIKSAAKFEQSMANVKAIMLTVVPASVDIEKEFGKLNAIARQLGATTIFSASQAANGLEFLGRAGFSVQQSLDAITGTLNLAAAGAISLASAADISTNVLAGFGLAAAEADRVADVLAQTAASANTDVIQLGEAMKFVAPIAASLGVSVETAAASVGILSNAGLKASLAGTGLRKVLVKLASPTKKLKDTMAKMSLSVDEVNPTFNDLGEIMEKLGQNGLGAADAIELFGDRGAPAALALANMSDELKQLNKELQDAEGTATDMAEVITNTLAGSFKLFVSALQEAAIASGESGFLLSLRGIIDAAAGMTRVLTGTQKVLTANGELNKAVLGYQELANTMEIVFALLVAFSATKFLGFLAAVVAQTWASVAAFTQQAIALRTVGVSIASLGAAARLALGPLGWIAALGTALYLFVENDAKATVDAMEDIERSIKEVDDAVAGFSLKELDREAEKSEAAIAGLHAELEKVDKVLDEIYASDPTSGFDDTGAAIYDRDEVEALSAKLEADLDSEEAKLERLGELRDAEAARGLERTKKRRKERQKIEGDANAAALTAVYAHNKAIESIQLNALETDKKIFKQREKTELANLKSLLDSKGIFEDEYYFRKSELALEGLAFDKAIAAQELVIQQGINAQELEVLLSQKETELLIAKDADKELIEKTFAFKEDALSSRHSVELANLRARQVELAAEEEAILAASNTAELDAIRQAAAKAQKARDKAKKENLNTQKELFDRRLTAIEAQREREIIAAERSVESGTLNQFDLAGEISTSNEAAIASLEILRGEMLAFNETAQDPETTLAIQEIQYQIDELGRTANPQLEKMKTTMTDGLAQALIDVGDGTKSAKDAFKDMGLAVIQMLQRMAAEALAYQIISKGFGLFSGGGAVVAPQGGSAVVASQGGAVSTYATGGSVRGPGTGTSDSIRAFVSNGEYIMNAKAVKHWGVHFMEGVNRRSPAPMARKYPITRPKKMRFADGGLVDSGASKGAQAEVAKSSSLRLVNVVDMNQTSDYLQTADGESMIINIIRRNGSSVKQLLG